MEGRNCRLKCTIDKRTRLHTTKVSSASPSRSSKLPSFLAPLYIVPSNFPSLHFFSCYCIFTSYFYQNVTSAFFATGLIFVDIWSVICINQHLYVFKSILYDQKFCPYFNYHLFHLFFPSFSSHTSLFFCAIFLYTFIPFLSLLLLDLCFFNAPSSLSLSCLFHSLLSFFITFLFILHFSHAPPFSPSVNLSHLYLPSHVPPFVHHSLSIFLSRRSPSPLVISNTILGSLLTLLTFTRFSPYHLHSVSCILLAILTPLSPSILFRLSCLFLRVLSPSAVSSHTLAEPTFVLLFGIASIHPFFTLSSSRFTSADGDRINRRRRRG